MYQGVAIRTQPGSAALAFATAPKRVYWILGILLAGHAMLLGYAAFVHSPTFNEPAHLAAGINDWRFGGFDLYTVNPPLVRMVAALPVLAVGCDTDWSAVDHRLGTRSEFVVGEAFIAANGERSFWLFTIARWACIPFSCLGGLLCFLWARDFYGAAAGLLAALLWCVEPNILAHASLMTPDVAASALGVAACYTYWRWLKAPSWRGAILTGVTLGVAELSKTTLIVFYPLWPVLWVVYRLPRRRQMALYDWLREGAMLLVRMVIALYVVNLGYGFEGSFDRLGEYQFVSQTLSGESLGEIGNRFTDSWIGEVPVPLPHKYLTGIDFQRRDFENRGRLSYLGGEFSESGWWYFYLYALAIKVPLGIWALLLLAAVLRLSRSLLEVPVRDELVLLAPALIILVLVSSQTGFSEHMRYVLPILPFALIWVSQLVTRAVARQWAFPLITASLVLWTTVSSLSAYPHNLAYFNELAGGSTGGPNHLLGSNIDWGQDLCYLKWWLEKQPETKPLHLAYYGYFDPTYVGITFDAPPPITQTKPISQLKPGWYAISINLLWGYPWSPADGKGGRAAYPQNSLAGFRELTPAGVAGRSIYIYQWPPHYEGNSAPAKAMTIIDSVEHKQ